MARFATTMTMDNNNNHDFREEDVEVHQPRKRGGMGRTVAVALVAALIGGGVGGGVSYYAISRNNAGAPLTTSSNSGGTTKVSNVSVKQSDASQAAFAKVSDAVVSVINLQKQQQQSGGDDWAAIFGQGSSSSSSKSNSGALTEYSEGSGVIYEKRDGSAYIVTNNHVVSGSDKLEVILSDGSKLTATMVGTDSISDLAVLKINAAKVKSVASFGDSSKIAAGQTVLAIGSPLGTQYATSVTQGIVSAKSRTVDTTDDNGNTTGQATVIQTDAAINSGNSGGPLINLAGQIIGINSMKLSGSSSQTSEGASIEGMGFAIPSDEVVGIINQLVTRGKVVRPALGISVVDLDQVSADQQSSILKLPSSVKSGVVVAGFTTRSIARNAGLKKYDVIVAVDGKNVANTAALHTELYKHAVGQTVKLTYYHGNDKKTVNVKLTETTSALDSDNNK